MILLTALCRANQGILQQSVGLMKALVSKHGQDTAKEVYKKTCPIVKSSIGQHIRHSMDHMEPVVRASLLKAQDRFEIHYDLRERGGLDEHDWDAAADRLRLVNGLLEELASFIKDADHCQSALKVHFMLSGDSREEFSLNSTVARELAFAAHHAIHHMALIRIIATNDVGKLSDKDLPHDFGRAPSTVNFDRH